MAKALKTAALIVGAVALVATGVGAVALGGLAGTLTIAGISTGTLFLVSGGLTLANTLLTKTPSVPSAQTSRLTASIDPRAFRKTALGQTALATDIRYEEWSGNDQEYCDWIIALASHAIDGVEEIWQDQEMLWSASTGVSPKYTGYFSVPHIVLEGTPANAFSVASGRWNQSARLTGCAYIHLRFKVTGNGKKAESPFASGVSTRLTIIGRGAKLYDPRRDSTVPGGSGPMRWDDQSTWRYTADDGTVIGENLALQILRVVLGWRIKNRFTGELRLATGSGVPGRRIDMGAFQVAANLCDELVNRSAGGQEPRYHGAGVISEGDDPKTTLDALCAACCGRFRDTGGKLALVIAHNDLAAAAADDGLNDNDVIGAFTWDPDPSLEATPTIVRGRYVDASSASLYQLIDYPEVRIASPDGQDRVMTLDLGLVESASQAQRIARQVLQRKQYQRAFSAPFDIRAWKYGVGDVVPFTFAPLGFNRALFRVAEQELGQGGTCNMTLTVEHQQIYAWDASDAAPVLAADPIVYDASKNPLVQAIAEAGETATWDGVTGPGKPENNATVGGTIGENVKGPDGEVLLPAEVLNSALTLDPDGTLTATIGGVPRVLGKLSLPDMNAASDAARRQIEADLASLAAAVAQLATGQQIVQNVLRDAGWFTDPASGLAKLYAIERRAEQITDLSVTLNAALAEIGLKATVQYVDQAIIQAQLGGQEVDLDSIFVRLTSAETLISGLQASIQLKADATIVTGLQGTVTNIQQSLDALDAVIASKASQTVVDAMGQRLTLAEQVISAFDQASISSAVTASRFVPANDDAAGGNAILGLLGGYDATNFALAAVATAKQELRALTDSNTSAIASLGLQLGVQIGAVTAMVAQETSARIADGQAFTSDLAAYKAATNTSLAGINTALIAQAGNYTSLAGQFTTLSASIGNFGSVTVSQAFQALADRTTGIEGKYTLAIDANGNWNGLQLIGGQSGPGSLNLINTDLRMGTGRVIFNNGAFMMVQGIAFGANNDLLSWYGPTMPISQCSRANGLEWKATDGSLYTSGSIQAGPLKNNGTGTLTAADASFTLGPFGSLGKPKTVVASYSFSRVRTVAPNGGGSVTGSPSATIALEIQAQNGNWSQVQTFTTGQPVIEVTPATSDGPGRLMEAMSGSVTWTDTRTMLEGYIYRLRILSRTQASFNGTATVADSVTQSLSIISQE